MPYCSRCGVEVDAQIEQCPLCEAPIQKLPLDDGTPWPIEEAPAPPPPPRSTDERIALAKTITTLGFLIPASIVIAVDWFVTHSLTWSLWTLSALGAAWMWALLPLIFTRNPYKLIFSITLVAEVLTVLLALLSNDFGWALGVAMPITALAGALSAGVTLSAKKSRKVGSNLAGWIVLAVGVLAMGTDMLVNRQFLGTWKPGWSIIVMATMGSIAALLLYLHYRPSNRTRLRRYFHV